jgi:uncharacterized protein (TIGR02117 family)
VSTGVELGRRSDARVRCIPAQGRHSVARSGSSPGPVETSSRILALADLGGTVRRALVGLIAAAALGGVACVGPSRGGEGSRPDEVPAVVHVVGHGWHTGVVVRRVDIPLDSWPELGSLPPTTYVEVGWGDRAFYETPDAGVGLAIKAAFASDASALHVAGLDRPPGEMFPGADVVAIPLSRDGVAALGRFVSRSYALDAGGRPIELGAGLYPGSRFYAATGRYSLLRTCNNWIAEALRAGGCPISPAWAITAGALLRQAERCRQELTSRAAATSVLVATAPPVCSCRPATRPRSPPSARPR